MFSFMFMLLFQDSFLDTIVRINIQYHIITYRSNCTQSLTQQDVEIGHVSVRERELMALN
jgi:hypothetical protein